jgi:hypothetical protein
MMALYRDRYENSGGYHRNLLDITDFYDKSPTFKDKSPTFRIYHRILKQITEY